MVCAASKASDQPVHIFLSVKLLSEHHLEFLNLKGGCIGSPESTLVKTLHCWKSHVRAQFIIVIVTVVGLV